MPTQRKEKYLPDFIIGGAMKCGTSSMHAILSSREDVFIPEGEVHFFTLGDPIQSPETVKFDPERTVFNLNDEKKVEWYRSFFEGADSDQLIGEDSTTYLSSRVAPERIRELLPDVKLIFMLRNPVDRSLSHYRHLVMSGRATKTFEQTLVHDSSNLHLRSFYKPQLERYFRLFLRDQVKVVLFERFVEETQTVIDEVCSYLGFSDSIDLKEVETHANASWYPRWPKTYFAINYLLKGKMDRYRHHWPGDPSEYHTSDISFKERLLRSLLIRLRRRLPKQDSYPSMDDSLQERLTRLYARKNRGIGNLVEANVGKYWPFD
ncbi:sulfotransferase family protein [Salinibacter ruber]|nr:sulfotransferase [Salinibacter ruber]MCS4116166.1 hypothetical protein [Salinibacter ruber]MCS4181677.1 hypothetical protein [Salinibacter ruber]